MKLNGTSIIGFERGSKEGDSFTAFSPETGESISPEFFTASLAEVEQAADLASDSRTTYGNRESVGRARFLRKIADNIEALGDELIERASLETGLPNARFLGERGRTTMQLRMFADLLDDGNWVDARIDLPDLERKPIPKPDVRSMLRPMGPVAVFCASNFPLAYSVAGGDTASALAAGCPVIVNAHFAHPGTAEMVGTAIRDAAESCGMPNGTFSLLFSNGHDVGQALVKNPAIKAVGFTGSRAGGRALMDIAADRNEPIPVFAEMSAVNPIFILPTALKTKADEIIDGLFTSVTTGAGQFCTKPGLVFVPKSKSLDSFLNDFKKKVSESSAQPLLTKGIRDNYEKLLKARDLDGSSANDDTKGFRVNAAFSVTDIETFRRNSKLSDEVFGPATLLIRYESEHELVEVAHELEGQLTATVHGTAEDLIDHSSLIDLLETKAGRLIFNGYPTGVEVGAAMVHGGPYPATSDSRSTAVGSHAIRRFSRYVAYQNFPEIALPEELRRNNPRGISRLVDGKLVS